MDDRRVPECSVMENKYDVSSSMRGTGTAYGGTRRVAETTHVTEGGQTILRTTEDCPNTGVMA